MFHYLMSRLHDSITYPFKEDIIQLFIKFSQRILPIKHATSRVLVREFKILPARAQKYKKEVRLNLNTRKLP